MAAAADGNYFTLLTHRYCGDDFRGGIDSTISRCVIDVSGDPSASDMKVTFPPGSIVQPSDAAHEKSWMAISDKVQEEFLKRDCECKYGCMTTINDNPVGSLRSTGVTKIASLMVKMHLPEAELDPGSDFKLSMLPWDISRLFYELFKMDDPLRVRVCIEKDGVEVPEYGEKGKFAEYLENDKRVVRTNANGRNT